MVNYNKGESSMSKNINIVVEGGCVTDVEGLPEGWTCTIEDNDTEFAITIDHETT